MFHVYFCKKTLFYFMESLFTFELISYNMKGTGIHKKEAIKKEINDETTGI
jgi:hypothetical protein